MNQKSMRGDGNKTKVVGLSEDLTEMGIKVEGKENW